MMFITQVLASFTRMSANATSTVLAPLKNSSEAIVITKVSPQNSPRVAEGLMEMILSRVPVKLV